MTSNDLAILTNNRQEVFQYAVIAGVQEVADQRGFSVTVAEIPQPLDDIARLPLKPQAFAGILAISNVLPAEMLETLSRTGMPLTLVSHCTGSSLPSITHDNQQGMALLMEHLVTVCERSKLAFICGDSKQNDGLQREAAFRQEAMRYALDIPESHFLPGDFEPNKAANSLKAFLATSPDIDGIVSADYLMGIAALEILSRTGHTVPADVAVVGFGDGPEADEAGLTTVAADVVELGRRAARQLIGQLGGLSIRGQTLLSTQLVRRQSTG